MQNKETYKYLAERKALLEKFKIVSDKYPNAGYWRIVLQLNVEIADIVDKLYKKDHRD